MTEAYANKITYEDLEFLKIEDRAPVYLPQIKSYDAVIIEYSSELATAEIIRKIRTHNLETIYLIPVFVYKNYDESKEKHSLIDGVIYSLSNLGKVGEITRKIKNKMHS